MNRPCRSESSNSGAIGDDQMSAHHDTVIAFQSRSGSFGARSFGSAFNVEAVEVRFRRARALAVFGAGPGTLITPGNGLGSRTEQIQPAGRVLSCPPLRGGCLGVGLGGAVSAEAVAHAVCETQVACPVVGDERP